MQNQTYRMAAVDMDCDGPSTTLYEVTIPANLSGENAHKAACEKITQSYFGVSDFLPITYEEREKMFPDASFTDASQHEVGVWHTSGNGNRFDRL